MFFDKKPNEEINERIDIESRKTANILMFALENDKKTYCKVYYVNKKIQVECVVQSKTIQKKVDQNWSIPVLSKDPKEIADICNKIAYLIARYTDNAFTPSKEATGIYRLIISKIGIEVLSKNIAERAKGWHKRFCENPDVKDWCENRIFKNGFPPKIIIRKNYIFVDNAVVIFDEENYDDLNSKEALYGLALCIAEYGDRKYRIKIFDHDNGPTVEMELVEQKKRKTW